jgi:hypothetical protein
MQTRIKLFQLTLGLIGIPLLFWWPLSQLFYPVWYHNLLGFKNPSQYAHNPFITVIGFAGFFPVMMLFFSTFDPLRNRDMIKILSIGSVLGCLTFLYLVASKQFPIGEMLNVSLFFVTALLLSSFQFWIKKLPKESNHVP